MRKIALLSALLILGCASVPRVGDEPDGRSLERGFMKVCWHNGFAVYPQPGKTVSDACTDPKTLDWEGFPKLVYWGLPKDFSDYQDSYKAARNFWNKEFNETIFATTNDIEKADISVVWGEYEGKYGAAMATRHYKNSEGKIVSTIYVKAPSTIRQFYLQLSHEFGHSAFGLAHDRIRTSIMKHSVSEAPPDWCDPSDNDPRFARSRSRWCSGRMRVWVLQSYDKQIIKRDYGLTD